MYAYAKKWLKLEHRRNDLEILKVFFTNIPITELIAKCKTVKQESLKIEKRHRSDHMSFPNSSRKAYLQKPI